VQIDALALRLRPRTPAQAADLGVRLSQCTARTVYPALAIVAVPMTALALMMSEWSPWWPIACIWWAKPWLDRTILFVLSRAAFGQPTTPRDVWRQQRHVWWRRLWLSLTLRRLSPWRSLTEPVYVLEGLPLGASRKRAAQIRSRHTWSGLMITDTFAIAEVALVIATVVLVLLLVPRGFDAEVLWTYLGEGRSHFVTIVITLVYAASVFTMEPFFVAAGFALYLNRRAELEAWDIEQEFRRAFR
jgi:hypothetical protein